MFTEYYGTEIVMPKKKGEVKVRKEGLGKVKSGEKTNRSKTKVGLLSPRGKPSKVLGKK